MLLLEARNATNVRNEFSQFVDDVVRERPQAVKRNRDHFWSISDEMVDVILEQINFSLTYDIDEDGQYSGYINEIDDLVFYGSTKEEMIQDAANQLLEYTLDYFNNFQRYFNAPNRKKHFIYVWKVANQQSLNEVLKLINA